MAHLTGTFLGIPLILQRQLKAGGFGQARRVVRVSFTSAGYMQGRHRKFIDGYLMGVARCSECWASAVWVEFDIVPYCHELYSRV